MVLWNIMGRQPFFGRGSMKKWRRDELRARRAEIKKYAPTN